MAQAGFTPISIYYSTTAAAIPTSGNLVSGELAINIVDEKLYFKNSAGTVKLLASNAATSPVLTFSAGTTGFTPSTATSGAVTLAGTLATTNGGTNLTSFTSGGAVYATSTSVLTTGTLPVASGGSGAATLTGVLKGNGTSAFTAATAGTDYVAPGTATTFTATQTFNGTSSTAALKEINIIEPASVTAVAPTATTNFYINTGAVQYITANNANNWTLNIAFSAGTTLNAAMTTNDSITCTLVTTNSATAYYISAVTIDGVSVTPKWQGGTAPTSGNASSIDSYTFVIIKTGPAVFTVLAAQTKFA